MKTPTPATRPATTGQQMEKATSEDVDAGHVTTESIIEVDPAMSSTPTISYQAPESTHGLQDQSIRLPFHRLLLIYFGIGTALFVSFLDQTSVSTAAPVIGGDIGGSESISWLGTAFLVTNCAMHLVYGRLSDIFGRKRMLHIALLFLGGGNLMCGFAKTPIQLYVFRAISGLGGGGVNGIAMTVVSDVVSLEDRGKYQGFISAACSLGTAVGPFVGGGLATAGQWRWLFWLVFPLSLLIVVLTHFTLPLKPVTGSAKEKLAKIDYLGIFLSGGSTLLLLVPISGGGSSFAWDSTVVIALLVVGVVMMCAFFVCEWKIASLPILPLHLFRIPTVSIVLAQSFLVGAIYYGNIFYVPIFFQYVMGYSALKTGTLTLAYTLPQSLYGIISGFIISKTNWYKGVIIFGSAIWTLGAGLQIMWTPDSSLGQVIGILEVSSIGVGCCLQSTLVAMMAVTPDKDRAVVTSSRNFFRTMGGAFGLVIANALFNNRVSSSLLKSLSQQDTAQVTRSAITFLDSADDATRKIVVDAYAHGLRSCFILFASGSGACFGLSLFIKEVKFRKDPPGLVRQATPTAESADRQEGQIESKEKV